MNKYIIELDENAKEVVVISLEDGDMWTNTMEVDDLELLNSDYINEHYGELQDTAYQRGLDDAWEAAKKIFGYEMDGGIPLNEIGKVFGYAEDAIFCTADIIRHNTASEAIAKLKAYEEKQKEDKIKVGDEVERYIDGKLDGKGIYMAEDDGCWMCLFCTGTILTSFAYPKEQFKRTGRHFDIDKILEELRHEP